MDMNARHARSDAEERWNDARHDHWHGAKPSEETSVREKDASAKNSVSSDVAETDSSATKST